MLRGAATSGPAGRPLAMRCGGGGTAGEHPLHLATPIRPATGDLSTSCTSCFSSSRARRAAAGPALLGSRRSHTPQRVHRSSFGMVQACLRRPAATPTSHHHALKRTGAEQSAWRSCPAAASSHACAPRVGAPPSSCACAPQTVQAVCLWGKEAIYNTHTTPTSTSTTWTITVSSAWPPGQQVR